MIETQSVIELPDASQLAFNYKNEMSLPNITESLMLEHVDGISDHSIDLGLLDLVLFLLISVLSLEKLYLLQPLLALQMTDYRIVQVHFALRGRVGKVVSRPLALSRQPLLSELGDRFPTISLQDFGILPILPFLLCLGDLLLLLLFGNFPGSFDLLQPFHQVSYFLFFGLLALFDTFFLMGSDFVIDGTFSNTSIQIFAVIQIASLTELWKIDFDFI